MKKLSAGVVGLPSRDPEILICHLGYDASAGGQIGYIDDLISVLHV